MERSPANTPNIPVRVIQPRCPECDRVFDLSDETDCAEFHYGHDCEAV